MNLRSVRAAFSLGERTLRGVLAFLMIIVPLYGVFPQIASAAIRVGTPAVKPEIGRASCRERV